MKNILMLHYDLYFYRIPFYESVSIELKKLNFNLIIWAFDIQKEIDRDNLNFELIDNRKIAINMENFKKIIVEKEISMVINFLTPSQPGYLFYVHFILYSYMKKIDLIYYGHGINLQKKDNFILKTFYNLLHLFYKNIILYTPNEKRYLWNIHQKKIHIAYNTLPLEGRHDLINDSRQKLKEKYALNDSFVVLFSGRIEERKKLNILISIFFKYFLNDKKIKLLIVGPGLDENIKEKINDKTNIIYLGPIYDKKQMAEIFYISDVFCIPGHIGLGLIEAFYWGKPVLTMDVKHAPEIYYMKHQVNGMLAKDEKELYTYIKSLLDNKDLLLDMSNNAKNTYIQEASIDRMINGFVNTLKA